MSEKTSIKSLIVAEKIRLNDAIAAYSNLMADLVSGKAVYEVLSDRAIESRLMACKARILALPDQMARRLLMKGKSAAMAELSEYLQEAIERLSDLSEGELTGEVVVAEDDVPQDGNENTED
jgi:hypothetical protein